MCPTVSHSLRKQLDADCGCVLAAFRLACIGFFSPNGLHNVARVVAADSRAELVIVVVSAVVVVVAVAASRAHVAFIVNAVRLVAL